MNTVLKPTSYLLYTVIIWSSYLLNYRTFLEHQISVIKASTNFVCRTIPWDKVDIEVLSVETALAGNKNSFILFIDIMEVALDIHVLAAG